MPSRLTRSKTDPTKANATAQLPSTDEDPYKVFILPDQLSTEARIVSLPNPATSTLNRYFVCPATGFYEFTKVAAPRKEPRSWLLVGDEDDTNGGKTGYVSENADAFVATPMDPLFFLVLLFPTQADTGMFRMEDDLVETLGESSKELGTLIQRPPLRRLLLRRLEQASEVRQVGDETLYRPDTTRLLEILMGKTEKMVSTSAWPTSMEETHVQRPLEVPLEGVHADAVSENITKLMRTRVALEFLISSYLPPLLRKYVQTLVSTTLFAPLDEHLKKVAESKAKAQALTSLSDNISRKRSGMDDDEAADARAEKKRKKDEEELRKKTESRAVKQLKKVDTSGMKKLSSFFGKAAPKIETAP